MAGDFVMVQCATPRKPEVLQIATQLDIPVAFAFGLCVQAWIWFDEQTEDGRATRATDAMLDAVVCRAGFAQALRDAGWLQVRDGSLVVPNFEQHMGQSAKKRAKNTKRQQKHRHASVAKPSRSTRDKSATKEEKRREEKIKEESPLPPLPVELATDEFRDKLRQWLRYKTSRREGYKPEGLIAMVTLARKRAVANGLASVMEAMERAMANGWQGWDQNGTFDKQSPRPARVNAGNTFDPEAAKKDTNHGKL